MTKAQLQGMTFSQVSAFYDLYAQLSDLYEEVYNGPSGARGYTEYHALRTSATNAYEELTRRMNEEI